MTYKIQLTGYSGSHTPEQAAAAFAERFKVPVTQAQQTLARMPVVIKSGVASPASEQYQQALAQCGLRVALIDEAASASPPEVAPVAASAPAPARVEASAAQPGMKFRIEARPDFAFLTVDIPARQTLKVESSAMATMDTHLTMKTKLRGGLGRLLTGESIFVNEFSAEQAGGQLGIAPASPGDMGHVYLQDSVVYLQNSAFVACSADVVLETKWQGLVKGFFSGESLFLIRASGQGDLWFSTYGGLIELDVEGDYVVDTGNIVAFTEGLEYRISKVGGYKSLFFSGEGLVCRFSGKGKVWIQTRAPQAFLSWVDVFRPSKSDD